MLDLALVVLIAILLVVRYLENESARKERDRLVRLAFAESKPERIAALLPSPSERNAARPAKSEGKVERPVKPLGI